MLHAIAVPRIPNSSVNIISKEIPIAEVKKETRSAIFSSFNATKQGYAYTKNELAIIANDIIKAKFSIPEYSPDFSYGLALFNISGILSVCFVINFACIF